MEIFEYRMRDHWKHVNMGLGLNVTSDVRISPNTPTFNLF